MYLKKLIVLLTSGDRFKTVFSNLSKLIFDQKHVSCIESPKTKDTFREALKMRLDGDSETFPLKIGKFY